MKWQRKPGRPRRADLLARRVALEAFQGWTLPAPIMGRIADVLSDEFDVIDRRRKTNWQRDKRIRDDEGSE